MTDDVSTDPMRSFWRWYRTCIEHAPASQIVPELPLYVARQLHTGRPRNIALERALQRRRLASDLAMALGWHRVVYLGGDVIS